MADTIDILINATDRASGAANSAKSSLDALNRSAKEGNGVLGSFQETGNQLWGILGGAATVALTGVAAGLGALGFAFKDSLSQATEQIAAQKQLGAVLTSTGGAAGVTADQAKKLSDSLSSTTNFTDDAVLSGENMLLTFTNIGSNVFPRATETALNMSQALGQDMKSSAIQLGKALNDPITGVTALQRVGVTFNDTQKDTIKTMVEAGNVAGAQGLILDELAKEFGGSAKAMADPAIMLKNQWGELEEQVGMFVIPVLNNLSKEAMPYVRAATSALSTAVGEFNDYLGKGYNVAASFESAIGDIIPDRFQGIWNGFTDAINVGITVLQELFTGAHQYEMQNPMVSWLLDLTDKARSAFGVLFEQSGKVIARLWDWVERVMPPLVKGLNDFFDWMGKAIEVAGKVLKPVGDAIAKFMGFDDVMTALGVLLTDAALPAIYGLISGLVAFLAPIAAVAAEVAVLRWAWESNFGNIRTSTEDTLRKMSDWFYTDSGLWKGTWETTFSNMYDIAYEFFRYKIYNEVMMYFEHTEHALILWVSGWEDKTKGWAQTGYNAIAGWGNDTVATLVNWKDRMFSTYHEWADPMIKNFDWWIITTKQQIQNWVWWWVGDLGLLPKWKKDVVGWFQQVIDWWNTNIQPWIDAGVNAVQGLWDGFRHQWNRFTSWASGVWQDWVDRFRNFFGIHSRSTLFYGFGGDMMQGLGEGIQAYSHVPTDYMDSVSNSLTSQLERIKGAIVQNVFDINQAASQLHIDPRLLPASMGGTGTVTGYGPNGELILGGITNLPHSSVTPPPVTPPPTNTLGTAVGGTTSTTVTGQGLLGGISLTTPDLQGAQDSAAEAAKRVKGFIAGLGDFLGQTVSTGTLSKVFQDAFSHPAAGAAGEGYTALQQAQDKIRSAMAQLLGLPQIYGALDASGNLAALTKKISAGTDLNKVAGLLQSAVDFRTLANYYDTSDQYGSALPTDSRLTGQSTANTTNYNITLQGSNNANADILGLVQMLGSLQGSATP